jgi:hypothetical protein
LEGRGGGASRLQVGPGHCCRGSPAKRRWELEMEPRFEGGAGPGRVAREVGLLRGQRCWMGGSNLAALRGGTQTSVRPGVPGTTNGDLPFCRGFSRPVLPHFHKRRGRENGLGRYVFQEAGLSGTRTRIPGQGWCPSPRVPLSLAARTAWSPRLDPGARPAVCLARAQLPQVVVDDS